MLGEAKTCWKKSLRRTRSCIDGPTAFQWAAVRVGRQQNIAQQRVQGQGAGFCQSGHARLVIFLPWACEAARGSTVNTPLAIQVRCQSSNVQQPVQTWVFEEICASM